MFLSVSLSASFCFCLCLFCFRVMARFRPVQTWPDLCLLLSRAHGGATWGHTVSAETELERPRGRCSPAVAVVAKVGAAAVCTQAVAYASRWGLLRKGRRPSDKVLANIA